MPEDAAAAPSSNESGDPIYRPPPGELQLTVRAVVVGCCLGALVSAMNIYFGLKTGWGIGGSLIAAILAYAFFSTLKLRHPFTPLETNIAQTSGSAAGTMTATAGLVACIPALVLLGYELSYLELTLWAAAVAWLGVFFAVPLRRQMILVEKLRFPTGTATAHTILAMFGSGEETVRKARTLLAWAVVAAVVTLGIFFVPPIEFPPFHEWLPVAALAVPANYTFVLLVSPLLIGAGILVGMRVSLSLLGGSLIGWAVLAPIVEAQGWVESDVVMNPSTGARGWILWPGVALMVADALTNLALSWRSVVGTFRGAGGRGVGSGEDPKQAIPNAWWLGGLAVASVLTMVVLFVVFDVAPWLTLLAILLSTVLAAIATRSTGETDINPISGVGKVTQLVYGGVAPGAMGTNLLAAGITGAGASQAADMMQDLKTGHLLGASPRKQFKAQLWGIAAGILICVPIYLLVTSAHPLGSDKLPAPAAFAWKAVAEILAVGLHAMPTNAHWGALAGLLAGIALPLAARRWPKAKPYLPSGLALGIGFLIFGFHSICFVIGAVAYLLWRKRSPAAAAALGFSVASGLIAGEGLTGIVTAALKLLGVEPLVT